jgi:hypothetical protein
MINYDKNHGNVFKIIFFGLGKFQCILFLYSLFDDGLFFIFLKFDIKVHSS